MTTTYTVFNPQDSDEHESGLTALEAMDRILTDDGFRYEIRPGADGRGWRLWHSDGSANSTRGARHFVATVAFSVREAEIEATEEIAATVITADWDHLPVAMTDDEFRAMRTAEVAGSD